MIANLFSILRIILGVCLFSANAKQKALLLFFAGWTDFLDGYFARFFNTQSKLGAILDPLADKLFITFLYLAFVIEHSIPLWVFLLFIARDLTIVLGYVVIKRANPDFSGSPRMLSKFNTGFQMWYPFSVLVQFYPTVFMWCAIATTIVSWVDYLITFKTLNRR